MAATLQDVVSANLVLAGVGLLNQKGEFEQFRSELDLDLPVWYDTFTSTGAESSEPRIIPLIRERIAMDLFQSKSSITIDYPGIEDLAQLAQVAASAINCTDLSRQEPQAFGYNIAMIFNQDSGHTATQYLGEHLFDYRLLGKAVRGLVGGSGELVFQDAIGQWTIGVAPRFDDEMTTRVFLGLNLHKDEQRLPGEGEITDSLEKVWHEGLAFMDRLDEGSVR